MSKESTPQRRSDDGFHVRKVLDLSHILTTFALAISAVMYLADFDTRITVIEDRQKYRDEQFSEMRIDIKEIKRLLWDYTRGDDD